MVTGSESSTTEETGCTQTLRETDGCCLKRELKTLQNRQHKSCLCQPASWSYRQICSSAAATVVAVRYTHTHTPTHTSDEAGAGALTWGGCRFHRRLQRHVSHSGGSSTDGTRFAPIVVSNAMNIRHHQLQRSFPRTATVA